MMVSIATLKPSLGIRTEWISAGACLILMTDTMVYLFNSRKHMFTYRRKEIKHKWKNEKVFGPITTRRSRDTASSGRLQPRT